MFHTACVVTGHCALEPETSLWLSHPLLVLTTRPCSWALPSWPATFGLANGRHLEDPSIYTIGYWQRVTICWDPPLGEANAILDDCVSLSSPVCGLCQQPCLFDRDMSCQHRPFACLDLTAAEHVIDSLPQDSLFCFRHIFTNMQIDCIYSCTVRLCFQVFASSSVCNLKSSNGHAHHWYECLANGVVVNGDMVFTQS